MNSVNPATAIKVLIVDDEEDLLSLLGDSLEYSGFNVKLASSVDKALAAIAIESPDIVLTDLRMPGKNGMELVDAIGASNNIPVVLMTAYADVSTPDAFDRGVSGFFLKPVDLGELAATLRRIALPTSQRWREPDLQGAFEDIGTVSEAQLGRAGLFVPLETNFPLVLESVAFTAIKNPRCPAFSGTGVVRWVRHTTDGALAAGLGVEISTIGPHECDAVLHYLEAQKPTSSIPIGKLNP